MDTAMISSILDGTILKHGSSALSTQSPEILSPSERIKRFGIECSGPLGDGISFLAGHWKPGGEYIQKLFIKNVGTTTKKLKYKLPKTRYFSMAFPEIIILSPGMFKEIDVVFRPVENDPYDDTIYIKMQEGVGSQGFHVPVRAFIEKLIVSCPHGIDLGYCPAYQTTTAMFQLKNTGEIDAPFRWESPAPFRIEPSRGVIPMGHVQDIKVSLFPVDASVFVSMATCVVGEGVHAIIPEPVLTTRFSGIGKHAYIVLSEAEISFGEVLSGTPPSNTLREVLLRNTSVVPAEFELIRHEGDKDEVFSVFPKKGVIEPLSEITVSITYAALAMGSYSLDRYTFKTPGNCVTTLTCKGMSMPPRISLFKDLNGPKDPTGVPIYHEGSPGNSINFRDVEIGKVETRLFFLRNDSDVDAYFSIVADEEGIFRIEPKQGRIPALLKFFPIKLFFSPSKPINYYRRIFVLIKDATPLFYDAMGTGHIRASGEIKEQRPAPIRHAHIQAYRNRLVKGLGGLNPDELDAMFEQDIGDRDLFALTGMSGTRAMSVTSIASPVTRNGETTRNAIAVAQEFFIESTDSSSCEITLSKSRLDFSYTPYMTTSEPQSVNLTNNTRGKVSVMWNLPNIHSDGSRSAKNQDSKSEDLNLPVFAVEPFSIDINPGKSQKFNIYFRPRQSNRNFFSELEAFIFFKNQRTFRLVHDHSLTPPWCVTVSCMGHTFTSGQLLAKGVFQGGAVSGGKLVFPACFAKEEVFETIMLRNTSNLPCTFQLELGFEPGASAAPWGGGGNSMVRTSSTAAAFTAKPLSGEIGADDFVLICIRFAPREKKKYIQMLRCIINGDSGSKLLLEGQGDTPFVYVPDLRDPSIDDPYLGEKAALAVQKDVPHGYQGSLFLKPTCVGLTTTRQITVRNGSRLPVRFRITAPGEATGILSISPMSGLLRGNEVLTLTITFAPKKAIKYDFRYKFRTFPIGGKSPRVLDARQVGVVDAPEVLQTLILDVICPGEISAMTFDPGRVTVDVRLVNTFEMKTIFLENVSDADLSYQLFYKAEFIPDSASVVKVKKVSSLRPLYLSREDPKLAEEASKWNNPDDELVDHSLFCEYPSGTLRARSRKCVHFTFYPTYAGLFEFMVYSRLQALDPVTGEPVFVSNEEAALLRTSQRDRDSTASSLDADFDCTREQESLQYVPLMANITARAAFPTMLIEDIRTSEDLQISDIEHLWSKFNLSELNYDLSTPPTEAEIKAFTSSTLDPKKLKRYAFEFTPAVIGSPPQTIYLRIRNNGFLTTSFHMHLSNEKELDLEQWCDEDEPSAELNRIISIIEELKCFSFEPSKAVLQPGESCMITLTYQHNHLKYDGMHDIPVLVKVDTGKYFYIDLVGRTIPMPSYDGKKASVGAMNVTFSANPSQSSIVPATAGGGLAGGSVASALVPSAAITDLLLVVPSALNGAVTFQPIPVGLCVEEAPRQRTELVNVSAVNAIYEVDISELEDLIRDNFKQPLIRLVNPKGYIAARSSVYLEWYFYPLEIREYEFNVRITYSAAPQQVGGGLASFDSAGSIGTTGTGTRRALTTGDTDRRASRTASTGKKTPLTSASGAAGKARSTASMADARLAAPQTISVKFVASGYDPREAKPLPLVSYHVGGLPPSTPIMRIPRQQVAMSNDLVDFDVIPQCCASRQMVIMQNILLASPVEFVVDDTSSFLVSEGLLTISPAYGRVDPGEHIVLHLTLCANTAPTAIADHVKIVVREVIKDSGRRPGGATARLKERIKNNKTLPKDHESVITHTTTATVMHQEHTYVPDGRNAALPSTLGVDGSIIEPGKAQAVSASFGDEIGNVYQHDGPMTGVGGGVEDRSRMLTAKSSAGSMPAMLDMQSVSRGDRTTGPERSRSVSPGGGLAPATSASAISIHAGTDASGRSQTGMSQSRNSSRSGREAMTLLGETTVVILRLKGDIFTISNVEKLLGRGPKLGTMKSFLVPSQLSFIPPATISRPTETGIVGAPGAVPAGGLGVVAAIPEGSDVLSMFSESSSVSTMKTSPSRGSKSVPPSPVGNKAKHKSNIHKPMDKAREPEVRDAVGDVLLDVFRSLLGSDPVQEYADAVLRDAAAAAPENGGVQLDTSAEPRELTAPLLGQPIYGVYFTEILPDAPLYERLVRELKFMGYKSIFSPAAREQRSTKEIGSGDSSSTYHGRGTSALDPAVAGIPAEWILGDRQSLVADALHFTLPRAKVLPAFQRFSITDKGNAYKKISAILDKYFLPTDPVCISRLITMLPPETAELVAKKVTEYASKRVSATTLNRRTPIAEAAPDATSTAVVDEAAAVEEGGLPLSSTSFDDISVANSSPAIPMDDYVDEEELAAAAAEHKQQNAGNLAALRIQKIARGKEARIAVGAKVQEIEETAVKSALCNEEFFDFAGDILYNTIFNLVQEASYGEFSIDGEPLKFVLKKPEELP